MTTSNDPLGGPHPEDLLAPYALDSLPEGETLQVESHLESCSHCREEVAQLLRATALLSQAVDRQPPPAGLESRLMRSLGRAQDSVAPVSTGTRFRFPWPKLLAPAAVAGVLLLAASLAVNFLYHNQVNKLAGENSNLTARLLQFSTEDSDLLQYLRQEELATYLTDNPSTEPLMLEPPEGAGDHQGVMLLAEDSRHAILLVSGMEQASSTTTYDVWLLRADQRVRMGKVEVDSSGWGTLNLYHPTESVLGFDKVVLSQDGAISGESAARDMVLEGSITSLKTSKSRSK